MAMTVALKSGELELLDHQSKQVRFVEFEFLIWGCARVGVLCGSLLAVRPRDLV